VEGENLKPSIMEYCESYTGKLVANELEKPADEWDWNAVADQLRDLFGFRADTEKMKSLSGGHGGSDALTEYLTEELAAAYAAREGGFPPDVMRMIEKLVLLETIDRKWMDHLYAMDLLKDAIHLRSFAQQDPKVRYKIEGFEMFGEMWDNFENEIAQLAMRVKPTEEVRVREKVKVEEAVQQDFNSHAEAADAIGANAGERHRAPIRNAGPKVKPNDLCPCGSGKKYKKCCGRK
jgi:preprotein translocase subunit SecA